MQIRVDQTDVRPLYVQIMDEIRRALVRGSLSPGDPLPSVRELAGELLVNPRTVSQAYAGLEKEGIVNVRDRSGTYVSSTIRPMESERPRLATEVAFRALEEAERAGLTLEDLVDALKGLIKTMPHEEAENPE